MFPKRKSTSASATNTKVDLYKRLYLIKQSANQSASNTIDSITVNNKKLDRENYGFTPKETSMPRKFSTNITNLRERQFLWKQATKNPLDNSLGTENKQIQEICDLFSKLSFNNIENVVDTPPEKSLNSTDLVANINKKSPNMHELIKADLSFKHSTNWLKQLKKLSKSKNELPLTLNKSLDNSILKLDSSKADQKSTGADQLLLKLSKEVAKKPKEQNELRPRIDKKRTFETVKKLLQDKPSQEEKSCGFDKNDLCDLPNKKMTEMLQELPSACKEIKKSATSGLDKDDLRLKLNKNRVKKLDELPFVSTEIKKSETRGLNKDDLRLRLNENRAAKLETSVNSNIKEDKRKIKQKKTGNNNPTAVQKSNEVTVNEKWLNLIHENPSLPKTLLDNYYTGVAQENSDKCLKVEPKYDLIRDRNKIDQWKCTYYLTWPNKFTVTGRSPRKDMACSYAAMGSLMHLSEVTGRQFSTDTHSQSLTSKKVESLNSSICKASINTEKTIPEVKHIKVDNSGELHQIQARFPLPKSTLNNFYQVLSEQIKDKTIKPDIHYKAAKCKQGVEWYCTYQLTWPENIKVTAKATTKKKASDIAALRSLSYLLENEKISSDGLPLVYTKEEVKKLTKKKQTEIKLGPSSLRKMNEIVRIFNDNLRSVVEETDYSFEGKGNELVADDSECANLHLASPPRFLGSHHYFAKEKSLLPISKFKDDFISLLQNNNCVIVKGEPGCGKSSRIPQYVLESWIKDFSPEKLCRIAVTQPRRIAAISLAGRVASERTEQMGHVIGYTVRLMSNFQPSTGRILYCTTGILLRHLQNDPLLYKFSHVILDEAHERDVNTDLLMNLLKRALKDNDQLRVVVMSATIDTEKFSEYFDMAPILNVPGFTFPIKKYFLDDLDAVNTSKTVKMCNGEYPQVVHEDVVKVLGHIHRTKPEGAVLVFLPGWEDLVKVQKLINGRNEMAVYLVHSKLNDSEQHKIFSRPPPGIRKIILATNIAETSITIDDVVYVVDTGIHKHMVFDNNKGINVLDMEWISKASANQRAGRAGRCSAGESYHLYTREKFETLTDYTSPKILNSSLTKIVLDSKVFSNNMNSSEFMNTLITPPEIFAVERAVDELKQLALLDEEEKLTPLGRTLVNFQMEPSLAKALVNSVVFKCTTPIVDIVTLFSSDTEIFGSLTPNGKENIKTVKSRFCKTSDHLALMRIYEKWLELKEELSSRDVQRFCMENYLVPYKLEFVEKLKRIHFDYLYNGLYECVPASDNFSDNDELVKAVLFSGTGTILEHRNWDIVKNRLKTNVNVLVTRNNHKATIAPVSVNFKRHKFPSNFLAYINETRSNIRRTTIVRESSLIPTISVLLFSNKKLEILDAPQESLDPGQVIIGIKDTKLLFLCDKEQANVLLNCKEAIDLSYKYLIHQMTCAGDSIPDFTESWDNILGNLSDILQEFKIE